jgi:uncharacterized protein (TIGR03792 family)
VRRHHAGVRLLLGLALILLMTVPPPPGARADDGPVVELLRLAVPGEAREAWLEAERSSWAPWLAEQDGFLGRDLYWDPQRQEGVLLIHWASRRQWKAIAPEEVARVQSRFERRARRALDRRGMEPRGPDRSDGAVFPLVGEGELRPLALDELPQDRQDRQDRPGAP